MKGDQLHVRPDLGLHGLISGGKSDGRPIFRFQERYLAEQCAEVCDHLDGLIAATACVVPQRTKDFLLAEEHGTLEPRDPELKLERAIWKMAVEQENTFHFDDVFIHSFQIPLRARAADLKDGRSNADWVRFDLMGADQAGNPAVIELKADSNDPVHMIVEAAKYGVAVKHNWSHLVKEIEQKFGNRIPSFPAHPLTICRLVCAAPKRFWTKWSGYKRQPMLWENIAKLCQLLGDRGFPVSFVSFTHTQNGQDFLPIVSDLKSFKPPLIEP